MDPSDHHDVQKTYKIFKHRILSYICAQPAAFSFILSLFLIAISLSFLGFYVTEKSDVPDIDAMKNWNAYVGKLGKKLFCFQNSSLSSSHEYQYMDGVFNKSAGSINCDSDRRSQMFQRNGFDYGTVRVSLNFSVEKSFFKSQKEALYSEMTGKDIGTKIKEGVNNSRIDTNIYLRIFIPLKRSTSSTRCNDATCDVEGCILISAPLSAVPIHMPHIHKDFTFGTNVFNSSYRRKPLTCNCTIYQQNVSYVYLDLVDDKNCTSHPSLLKLPNVRMTRDYGMIQIQLNKNDKSKASQHMLIAAVTVVIVGFAFIFGIVMTDRPMIPKTSQE